jgi:hypothetical protein
MPNIVIGVYFKICSTVVHYYPSEDVLLKGIKKQRTLLKTVSAWSRSTYHPNIKHNLLDVSQYSRSFTTSCTSSSCSGEVLEERSKCPVGHTSLGNIPTIVLGLPPTASNISLPHTHSCSIIAPLHCTALRCAVSAITALTTTIADCHSDTALATAPVYIRPHPIYLADQRMRHQLWHFDVLQHINYTQGDDTKTSTETRRVSVYRCKSRIQL